MEANIDKAVNNTLKFAGNLILKLACIFISAYVTYWIIMYTGAYIFLNAR